MNLARVLIATTLALGVSSAWADLIRKTDKAPCSPTVHFKRHIMFSGSAATDHWLLVTGYSRLCRHM